MRLHSIVAVSTHSKKVSGTSLAWWPFGVEFALTAFSLQVLWLSSTLQKHACSVNVDSKWTICVIVCGGLSLCWPCERQMYPASGQLVAGIIEIVSTVCFVNPDTGTSLTHFITSGVESS